MFFPLRFLTANERDHQALRMHRRCPRCPFLFFFSVALVPVVAPHHSSVIIRNLDPLLVRSSREQSFDKRDFLAVLLSVVVLDYWRSTTQPYPPSVEGAGEKRCFLGFIVVQEYLAIRTLDII